MGPFNFPGLEGELILCKFPAQPPKLLNSIEIQD